MIQSRVQGRIQELAATAIPEKYGIEALTGGTGVKRIISTASRTFTLYEVDDYRDKYLKKRIPPTDIKAFPLPHEEAQMLFGKKIARNYFVVRLSLKNLQDEDRLVNTGLIRARGRALVETTVKPYVRFTVPIEVAPHSATQLYTLLDDEDVNETRSIVFRTLEFVGTLGAASVVAFQDGINTTWKNVTQLYTGVFIPEAKKLVPDRMPGYKRNIVNFAMADLVKVPRGGVTAHKYLFFPRNKIEGMIIDHYSYGPQLYTIDILNPSGGFEQAQSFEQPDSFVAFLVFDNMEIPFQQVVPLAPSDLPMALMDLTDSYESEIKFRQEIMDKWSSSTPKNAYLFVNLRRDTYNSISKRIDLTYSQWNIYSAKNDPEEKKLIHEECRKLLASLKAYSDSINPESGSYYDLLVNNNEYGVKRLNSVLEELKAINRAILSGADPKRYEERKNNAETLLELVKSISAFYKSGAVLLKSKPLSDSLLNTGWVDGDDVSETVFHISNIENIAFKKNVLSIISLTEKLSTIRGSLLKDIVLKGHELNFATLAAILSTQ